MCGVLLNLSIVELTTNETLEREDGVGRVDDRLPLSWQSDETLPMFRERDDRRCCPRTLRVLNHLRRLALHNGDAGICCSKVDTDDWAYTCKSQCDENTPKSCASKQLTVDLGVHIPGNHRPRETLYVRQ